MPTLLRMSKLIFASRAHVEDPSSPLKLLLGIPLLGIPLLGIPLLRIPLLRIPLLGIPLLRISLLRIPLLRIPHCLAAGMPVACGILSRFLRAGSLRAGSLRAGSLRAGSFRAGSQPRRPIPSPFPKTSETLKEASPVIGPGDPRRHQQQEGCRALLC